MAINEGVPTVEISWSVRVNQSHIHIWIAVWNIMQILSVIPPHKYNCKYPPDTQCTEYHYLIYSLKQSNRHPNHIGSLYPGLGARRYRNRPGRTDRGWQRMFDHLGMIIRWCWELEMFVIDKDWIYFKKLSISRASLRFGKGLNFSINPRKLSIFHQVFLNWSEAQTRSPPPHSVKSCSARPSARYARSFSGNGICNWCNWCNWCN